MGTPPGEYDPGGHATKSVASAVGTYPAGAGVQAPAPDDGLYMPAGQGEHDRWPPGEYVPGLQGTVPVWSLVGMVPAGTSMQ